MRLRYRDLVRNVTNPAGLRARRGGPRRKLIEVALPLDAIILAIVEVASSVAGALRHIREPFSREPDVGATRVTHKLVELPARAEAPA